MGLIGEFKQFAMRGNVVDMAVGIVIGGAFGTIVKSMVDDVMMPPLGAVLGQVDFSQLAIAIPMPEGLDPVEIRYGKFINSIVSFTIVAFALFLLIKVINKLQKQEAAKPAPPPEPTTEQKLLGEIRDLLKAK